ncbi:phage distal tail protein [Actinoallomurus iriomotensis]|uniref:Siphovirus-type tail component C-terminal domain-containing protein n=1 Tax=Actinoallomurus iriomotensis TaxID=478107 RepID=A0A9W6VWQ6_9ACTN|nr:phage tail domain-containing protein [Actinoallomurus iriomotensis]GLY81832.1 hypothetical protein Airi01_100990 [Actinoallomurus iriomotensis]
MSIPAIEPPAHEGPSGLPPGFRFGGYSGAIDDSAGSGIVIPLGQVDDEYVHWRVTDISGWAAATLDEGAENIVGEDGAFDAENYYGARTVGLKGQIRAPDRAALEAARDRLMQVLPPRRLVKVRLDEAVPKFVMARRTGEPLVDLVTDTLAEYDVTVLAPDPRKYADDGLFAQMSIAVSAPGLAPPWTPPIRFPARPPGSERATVTNAGTYETQPFIRLDGPGRDLQVLNDTTGLHLAYDVELGVGDFLDIDCRVGSALLNGVANRSPVVGSAITTQFVLVRGPNRLRFLGTATDPDLVAIATIRANSAWD